MQRQIIAKKLNRPLRGIELKARELELSYEGFNKHDFISVSEFSTSCNIPRGTLRRLIKDKIIKPRKSGKNGSRLMIEFDDYEKWSDFFEFHIPLPEFAKKVHYSRTYITELANDKKIRGTKIGTRWWIPLSQEKLFADKGLIPKAA